MCKSRRARPKRVTRQLVDEGVTPGSVWVCACCIPTLKNAGFVVEAELKPPPSSSQPPPPPSSKREVSSATRGRTPRRPATPRGNGTVVEVDTYGDRLGNSFQVKIPPTDPAWAYYILTCTLAFKPYSSKSACSPTISDMGEPTIQQMAWKNAIGTPERNMSFASIVRFVLLRKMIRWSIGSCFFHPSALMQGLEKFRFRSAPCVLAITT